MSEIDPSNNPSYQQMEEDADVTLEGRLFGILQLTHGGVLGGLLGNGWPLRRRTAEGRLHDILSGL